MIPEALHVAMDLDGAFTSITARQGTSEQHLGGARYDRQRVSNLVRNATCHHAQGRELLGSEKLRLQFPAFREIAADGHKSGDLRLFIAHWRAHPRNGDRDSLPAEQFELYRLGTPLSRDSLKDEAHVTAARLRAKRGNV